MLKEDLDKDMDIRTAASSDVDWMYHCNEKIEVSIDIFRKELQNKYISWIVEVYGKKIGYILTSNIKEDSLNMHLVLHPTIRGLGYGLQAIEAAIEHFNVKFAIDKFYFKVQSDWSKMLRIIEALDGELVYANEDELIYLITYN